MKTLRLLCALVFVAASFDGPAQAAPRVCAVANGDAQRVTDVGTTNASGVVTSATGKFVAGDVGKTVFLVKNYVNRLAVNTTTISVFTNATTVTLAASANATDTNVTMVWATGESSAAFTTQVTNCKADTLNKYHIQNSGVVVGNNAGDVTFQGNYLVAGCVYDVNLSATTGSLPGFLGGGLDQSILFFAPTVTACTDPSTGIYAAGSNLRMGGFTLDGSGGVQATSNPIMNLTSVDHADISNINIFNYAPNGAAWSTFKVSNIAYSTIRNIQVQAGGNSSSVGYLCDMSGAATNVFSGFCSNSSSRNVIFRSAPRSPTVAGPLVWQGGGFDECSDGLSWCTVVDVNSEADLFGVVAFSTTRIEGGGVLYVTDGNMGMFNSANRVPAADIAATGAIYSQQTTWRGNVNGKIVNRGTFVDGLGNTYQTCTGTSCTVIKAAQMFSGNQPITR
jgi:hypothetical protein